MLRESLSQTISRSASMESLQEPLHSFPSNSTIKANAKRKVKAAGAKTMDENDGPGEHEDVVPLKPTKFIEDTFDDCGDDTTVIQDHEDKSMLCIHCFELASTDYVFTDSDTEGDSESMLDNEYITWNLPGSENPENLDEDRPFATSFATCVDMVAYLATVPGYHDVFELFGGKGLCSQIAVRRKLIAGPNFDTVCQLDLEDPSQVEALWEYIVMNQPRIVIAGPPCTAFGAWSRLNKTRSPEAYQRSLKVGMSLAILTAEICMYQLSMKRHFIVENPWGSAIWSLPCFVLPMAQPGVSVAKMAQCMTGLRDPDGILTRKLTCFLGSCPEIVCRVNIDCDNSHAHVSLAGQAQGLARCKFAQVWTRRLCELIVAGCCDVLRSPKTAYSNFSFATVAAKDPYGGSSTCPGCTSHAARHDVRHDRRVGVGRFSADIPIVWSCNACGRHLPSTHRLHAFDDTCQWTHAAQRQRGYEKAPAVLREPTVPPAKAPTAAVEEIIEPPVKVAGMEWIPVTCLKILATLDICQSHDGWRKISPEPLLSLQQMLDSYAVLSLDLMPLLSLQDPVLVGFPRIRIHMGNGGS